MERKIHKTCKGCMAENNCYFVNHFLNIIDCPCSKCIVKVKCFGTCDKLDKYIKRHGKNISRIMYKNKDECIKLVMEIKII